MANTYTDLLKLRMPALGDVGWDDEVNDNTEMLEFFLGSILKSNVVIDGLAPSDGGGLDVDVTAGNVVVGGAQYAVGSGSKTCTSGVKNWLYVDDSGVLQIATTQPTGDFVALAMVDAGSSTLTRIADCRNFAEGALTIGITNTPDNYEADTSKTGAINQHLAGIDTELGLKYGFANLIYNPEMAVAQRGTSFTGLTNGSTGYTLDRWQWAEGGAVTGIMTVDQWANAPRTNGFSFRGTVTTAQTSLAAADYYLWVQRFEGQDLVRLEYGTAAAKTTTLSFWVKGSTTGKYYVYFFTSDDARSICQSFTLNAADTWEFKTITIPGDASSTIPNDNTQGMSFGIVLACGTDNQTTTFGEWQAGWKACGSDQTNLFASASNYLAITDFNWQVGEFAAPIQRRPYPVELALCQRYFIDSNDAVNNTFTVAQTTNGQTYYSGCMFPQEMRNTPNSVTIASIAEAGSGFNGIGTGDITAAGLNKCGFRWQVDATTTSTSTSRVGIQYQADAEL